MSLYFWLNSEAIRGNDGYQELRQLKSGGRPGRPHESRTAVAVLSKRPWIILLLPLDQPSVFTPLTTFFFLSFPSLFLFLFSFFRFFFSCDEPSWESSSDRRALLLYPAAALSFHPSSSPGDSLGPPTNKPDRLALFRWNTIPAPGRPLTNRKDDRVQRIYSGWPSGVKGI